MTVPTTFDDFIDPAMTLLEAFDAWRKDVGITTSTVKVDHLGYQCGDSAEFKRLRALVEDESTFIFQSKIAGRRIVLARLERGLHTKLGVIELMEIADQKPDGSKVRGFDHVEIYPTTTLFEHPGRVESLVRRLNGEYRDPRFLRLPEFVPSGRKHHPTLDAVIRKGENGEPDFKVRLEPEALLVKIARDEFR